MYSPIQGRFLSRDPRQPHGADILYEHPFAYAQNSPTNHVDPSGLQPTRPPIPPLPPLTPSPLPVAVDIGLFLCCLNQPWETKCDPRLACATFFAPPLPPPRGGKPGAGTSCHYGKLQLSVGFQSWSLQCVCVCAGNSPGMNCVRGCIQCARNENAPVAIATEFFCRTACPLTPNEIKRVNCCLNTQEAEGGCSHAFFVGGNPSTEYRGGCDQFKIP